MRCRLIIACIRHLLWGILLLSCFPEIALSQTAKEYQQQASELARNYRFPEAVELLQTGLRQHPGHLELARQLGVLLVRTGKLTEGERLLREALARQPHQLELLDALAEAELRQGRPGAAVSLLEDVLWHRPEDAQVQYRLAQAHFLNGEFQRALEPAHRSVELNPRDSAYLRFYSLLLDIQGKKEESYHQLKAACQLDPQNDSILFQLGEKERQAGRLQDGVALLRKASQLDPENPLYHSALSQLYEKLGQKDFAAQEGEKASELTEAFEGYAKALELATNGERQAAADALEPLVQKHPEFATGAVFLAGLYSRMGREQQALDLYLTVVKRYPGQASARQEAAWILAQRGQHEQALKTLGKLSQEDSGRSLFEAYGREQATDYAGALEALQRVQSENPLNPDLLLWIAHCLSASGQSQQALEVLDKADRLRPGNTAIQEQVRQIRLGRQRETASQLFQARQWKAALRELTALAEREDEKPSDAATLFQIAYCHQQLGKLKEALRHYHAGLQADPQASWARQNLAVILYQLRRYLEAANEWER
ncbi:MAG TPA: tetratricopeptide repeat protein, partial [Terriglobia bacterium]|nr:tetratricopeptide repeat protein [Terriglobia bacterium]